MDRQPDIGSRQSGPLIVDRLCFVQIWALTQQVFPICLHPAPPPPSNVPKLCHISLFFHIKKQTPKGSTSQNYRQAGGKRPDKLSSHTRLPQRHLNHSVEENLCWQTLGSRCSTIPAAGRFSLVPKSNFSHCNLSSIPSRHRKQIAPFPQLPSTHLKTIILLPLSLFPLGTVKLSHRAHFCSPSAWRYHTKQLWHIALSHAHTHMLPHSRTIPVILPEHRAQHPGEELLTPFAHISGPRWLKSACTESESSFPSC